MKKVIAVVLLVCVVFSFQSCMTTKVDVGTYYDNPSRSHVYSKGKQVWILGLIPLGHANVKTPQDGCCQVKMYHGLGDIIITALTLGIIETETVKIMAPRPAPSN